MSTQDKWTDTTDMKTKTAGTDQDLFKDCFSPPPSPPPLYFAVSQNSRSRHGAAEFLVEDFGSVFLGILGVPQSRSVYIYIERERDLYTCSDIRDSRRFTSTSQDWQKQLRSQPGIDLDLNLRCNIHFFLETDLGLESSIFRGTEAER